MHRKRARRSDAAAAPPPPAVKTLVVWDFDWSLINENSDTFVIEQLDPSQRIMKIVETKARKMGWTQLMDLAVAELHRDGHTPEALLAALATAPVLGGSLKAIAAAKAQPGTEQRILSDANTVYIDAILQEHGHGVSAGTFASVVTNDAAFDAQSGQLRIRPHQPPSLPHGCPNCPPNLCKGLVLDRWLAEEVAPQRIVYVGDGGGDFCPAMRLRPQDVLLARRAPHDGLLSRCRRDPQAIRAQILEWDEADDGEALLQGVLHGLQPPPPPAATPAAQDRASSGGSGQQHMVQ